MEAYNKVFSYFVLFMKFFSKISFSVAFSDFLFVVFRILIFKGPEDAVWTG